MSEALAVREPQAILAELPQPIAELVDDRLPPLLAWQAFKTVFAGAPVEKIALALAKAKTAGLDPLSNHIAVFQPRKGPSEPWVTMVTVEGRIEIGSRHPDFGPTRFSEPRVVGNEVIIDCWAKRRSWSSETGPVAGRCKLKGNKSQAKGGGTYEVEWAPEIARARALRAALRIVYGTAIPDARDDLDRVDYDLEAEPAVEMMREDQRKELFVLAGELGFADSDEERHRRAGVGSWKQLSEERAAELIVAWRRELEEREASIPARESVRGRAQAEADSNTPKKAAKKRKPASTTPEVEGGSTHRQRQILVLAAQEFGWDRDQRIARARLSLGIPNLASFKDLTFDQAKTLIESWAERLQKWRENRRQRLASELSKRRLGDDWLEAQGAGPLPQLNAKQCQELIDTLEASDSPAEKPPVTATQPSPSSAAPAAASSELRDLIGETFAGPVARARYETTLLARHKVSSLDELPQDVVASEVEALRKRVSA
jgi:hypothetical protein